ncbi:MAG: OsmC family peroxiredoxin [Chloroflexi bacterium]|nr:MAG: OsmC family peroxiredoxin [Chloroflexota bacterium]
MMAQAQWSGQGFRFELSDDRGHAATADEGPPLGAGDGMSPANLLLAALCACTGITAISLLRKMKQPLTGLTVTAEGDRQPEWPRAFTVIRLVYEISGEGPFDEALVRKATRLAPNRLRRP